MDKILKKIFWDAKDVSEWAGEAESHVRTLAFNNELSDEERLRLKKSIRLELRLMKKEYKRLSAAMKKLEEEKIGE